LAVLTRDLENFL